MTHVYWFLQLSETLHHIEVLAAIRDTASHTVSEGTLLKGYKFMFSPTAGRDL